MVCHCSLHDLNLFPHLSDHMHGNRAVEMPQGAGPDPQYRMAFEHHELWAKYTEKQKQKQKNKHPRAAEGEWSCLGRLKGGDTHSLEG